MKIMSLETKLAEIRKHAPERIPADALEKMSRATAELRESGIGDRALDAGAQMPHFALADTEGATMESRELLKHGPLVVTFYRGTW